VSFLARVWSYVDALVHPAAQQDALTLACHRAFIAPRLLGSLGAIASLPVYISVGIFSWLAVPILIAYYLSRTGLYERAHFLSSVSVTALVIPVAACTGGITSFPAIWLALVPLEAAFSASRRVIALATIFALVAAAGRIARASNLASVFMLPSSTARLWFRRIGCRNAQ